MQDLHGAMKVVIGGKDIGIIDEGGGVKGGLGGWRHDDQVASNSEGKEGKEGFILHEEGVRGNEGGV